MPGSQQDPTTSTPLALDGPASAQHESMGTAPAALSARPLFGFQPKNERSTERLVALQHQRDDLLACSHSLADFERFMREVFIPEFNAISLNPKMCVECGVQFAFNRATRRFCSEPCSARVRARGRSRPEVKAAIRKRSLNRTLLRLQEHWKTCRLCTRAKKCDQAARMAVKAARKLKTDDPRFAGFSHGK